MRPYILLLIVFSLFGCAVLSQDRFSQIALQDSIAAVESVTALKQNVPINSEQEVALLQAEQKEKQDRREVFKKYWKTPAFRSELAKAVYCKDSVYRVVLGKEKYLRYCTYINIKRMEWEQVQKQRYQRQLDSLSTLKFIIVRQKSALKSL